MGRRDNKVGTGRRDNKAGIRGRDDEAGIGKWNNGVGDLERQGHDKMSDLRQKNEAGLRGRDDEEVAKLVTRTYYIGAQRLSRCTFFLAMHSNLFLIFSSLGSVIG